MQIVFPAQLDLLIEVSMYYPKPGEMANLTIQVFSALSSDLYKAEKPVLSSPLFFHEVRAQKCDPKFFRLKG